MLSRTRSPVSSTRSPRARIALVPLALACAVVAGSVSVGRAQQQTASPPSPASPEPAAAAGSASLGPDALPAVRGVPLAAPLEVGFAAAGTLAYGYTEGVVAAHDAHHRVAFTAAGSYAVLDYVALGARLQGRFGAHSGGESDDSFALGSRLSARVIAALHPEWTLGGELGLGFPAAQDVGAGLSALSPELMGFATFTGAHPRLVLSALAGVRFDRSSHGVHDTARLSVADRVALGASDSSALLLGVAGIYAFDTRLSVLGELGWDVLVGARAPGAFESPLRLTGGVRYGLLAQLSLDAFITLSPSARPAVAEPAPLSPIEPRVALGVGVSSRFVAPPTPGVLRGRIVDELGQPIASAVVVAADTQAGRTLRAQTGPDGRFELTSERGARLRLRAQAESRVDSELSLTLAHTSFDLGDWSLPRARGSLSGRVLGPDGAPLLGARVTAHAIDAKSAEPSANSSPAEPEPAEPAPDALMLAEALTDGAGVFWIRDLPAGPTQVRAEAVGLRPAQARATVSALQLAQVELKLQGPLPAGQIRGTVRGVGGAPLQATIRLLVLGEQVVADRDGAFSIDVAPGRYDVLVTAPGYEPQQRSAEVEHHGVTVLLVDLVRHP